MMEKYILQGHTPVPEPDVQQWAVWYETADRTVAKTQVEEFQVSTVFLTIDHNWMGGSPPLLFETMVFGPDSTTDLDMERYSTWEEAAAGHSDMVVRVQRNLEHYRDEVQRLGAEDSAQ